MLLRRCSYFCGLIFIGILCWFFPLFHIRPLGGIETVGYDLQDATEAVRLETPRLLESLAKGTDLKRLWDAFDNDAVKARGLYGRQAGLGGAFYFCVSGRGTVESVRRDRVTVTIEGTTRRVCLELGLVVDNTVREAVGVKASDYQNSQEFNAVSTALNRQVEEEVIAPNRASFKPGAIIQFVGCAKLSGKPDLDPLYLIPIQLAVQKADTAPAGSAANDSGDLHP